MKSSKNIAWVSGVIFSYAILFWATGVGAQQMPLSSGAAPALGGLRPSEVNGLRLVQFSGGLRDPIGQPLTGVVGIETAVYKDQQGGAALWSEIQNVQLDSQGNYTVLLGATTGEGVPLEIFSSSEPRWLGVRALIPESEEQPRLLFVSVPYALKAADADTLGGKPISAFVLADSASNNGAQALSDKNSHTSDITVPGPPNSLAKYDTNGVDLISSPVTEVGGGNVIAPGSFTGAAHWLNGFGSAFNSNGYAMSAPNTIIFSGNGQPRITIVPNGDIGIGTTTPTAKLDVTGTVRASALGLPASTGVITLGGNRVLHGFGSNNIFLGTNAGNFTTTGQGNTAIGSSALGALAISTSGSAASFNTATGASTLSSNTTGSSNTASGYSALFVNTTGNSNTATGVNALRSNTTGSSNTAIGGGALTLNTTGGFNTATGISALLLNTTGDSNAASGAFALQSNSTGSANTATGYVSLLSNTTGSFNTASGAYALGSNTTGSVNLASGYSALYSNSTGFGNTANGPYALYYSTTGSFNTAIGYSANEYSTTGFGNTAVGYFAGAPIIENANTTGSNNTFIGYQAGPGTPTQLTNATALGANALVSASNAVVLGDSAVRVGIGTPNPLDKLDVTGDIRVGTGTTGCVKDRDGTVIAGTCSSDGRLKQNIEPFENLLEKIVAMQPVYFDWRSEEYPEFNFGPSRSFGLIAQEVEKVLPEMVTQDEKGYKAVKYSQLPLMLLEAVRELRVETSDREAHLLERVNEREAHLLETVKEQQSLIQQLRSDLEGLKAHLKASSNPE